jgi:hypothetical protein
LKRSQTRQLLRFAAEIALGSDGGPPREFRVLRYGLNPNLNGPPILFDEEAAGNVAQSFKQHGTDAMIDLEHLSLDDTAPNYDPDARAWFKWEVRKDANGKPELWAAEVSWTPDGTRRLSDRTQRYFSPVFRHDAKRRPTRMVNLALCAMPALDSLEPLVAAKEAHVKLSLSTALVAMKMARRLHKSGVGSALIVKTLAEGDGGDGAGEVAGVDIAALADFLAIDVNPAQDPAGFVKAVLAKLDEVAGKLRGEEAAPTEPAPAEEMADEKKPEEVAAAKLMLRIGGWSSFSEGVLRLNEWHGIVKNHQAEQQKLSEDKAAIELTERTALVVRLQKAGAETPATSGLTDGKLVKRLAEEPIAALRERVSQIEAAKGITQTEASAANAAANAGAPGRTVLKLKSGKTAWLDAGELKACAEMKCEPATFAERKYPNGRTV